MIRMLGRYELLEQVGSGGMAVVYRGRDSALDREVAVKLLHPHLAEAAESRARFSREARAVARLAHPGIVEIYDYAGDGAPEAYLVTEFVRGRTLRAFAQQVGFGFPEVGLLVGRALSDALVHAHSAGVIHRDLKPENVLVQDGPRPAVKLADFGIARILASDERMTMTGALVGSPHHMAPEIVEGREADARSDLFSLGTILYWLATGQFPFAASNPTAILRRAIEGDFEDPRELEPRVSARLAALLGRCLAVDPAARPQSAAEVRDALDDLLAEVGLTAPEEALVAFLSDPEAFKASFPARAVTALVARGDEAMRSSATARALALFDRALALEPGNAEVPQRLRSLSRRRRRRLSAASAAAAVVAAALVAALVRWWPGPSSAPAAAQPPPDPGPVETAAAPGGEPGAESPAGPGDDGRPPAPAPHPAPAPAAAQHRPPPAGATAPAAPGTDLTVHVRPYAQRALLDGVEVATAAQVLHLTITPGRSHTLQLEHPCCAVFTRELTAEEAAGLGELRVPLQPRPARLRVDGDPATRILVGGHDLGSAGESQRAPISVSIPAGGENPYEAVVLLELAAPGGARRSVPVRLRAGSDLTVAAPTEEPAP